MDKGLLTGCDENIKLLLRSSVANEDVIITMVAEPENGERDSC